MDRDNRYLWRFNPTRMEAEVIRDSILNVAGDLDTKLGGPEIDHALGFSSRRRSLYFAHHGESKMEFLEMFDAANPCDCYTRSISVLPQQALALANSELTLSHGRQLSAKLWSRIQSGQASSEASEAAFIEAAFEQILSREPSARELEASLAFLRRQTALFSSPGTGAASIPIADPAARARENMIQMLFSHNDFVTVR